MSRIGGGGDAPPEHDGNALPEHEADALLEHDADAPLEHDGMPILGYWRGEPIPDLDAMPEEEWLEALRPLSPFTRSLATGRVRTVEQAQKAMIIKGTLIAEDGVPSRGVERALYEERRGR